MLSFLFEMTFEGVEGEIPEPADLLEVFDKLCDCLAARWDQLVDLLASVFLGPDQARLLEQTGMFADRRATDGKASGERTGTARSSGEAA